jgi:hypothetical protein
MVVPQKQKSTGMITWSENNKAERTNAIAQYSESVSSYGNIYKASASDLRTIRPDFNREDYDFYRPQSAVSGNKRRAISLCMKAYKNTGIIRNIIDLMGDFGSQGINLIHRDKSTESFYQQWWKKIGGKERSERILNNLYRTGNVVVYRSYATINDKLAQFMKSVASDVKIQDYEINIGKDEIPFRYNLFNPLNLDIREDGNYYLNLSNGARLFPGSSFNTSYKTSFIPNDVFETLPKELQNSIRKNDPNIKLDRDRLCVMHYKKDDWEAWADPLIFAILDDIMMLERMRLADISALDGAISNIRLWTIGSLEERIFPTKEMIDRLREILSSNHGGGTMELVWGPELSFKESATQVHKFLGSQKYEAVLSAIYAGMGVPPTLTGQAGNGGGFTNNFISLKTLVERLQYGRDQLVKFWEREIELVRKAMGFRYPAEIRFDQMNLSDENAEKNLLIQLADRDIISHETLLERFKESSRVEKNRLMSEKEARENEELPQKASPFHNGNFDQEVEKMDIQHTKDLEINKMQMENQVKIAKTKEAMKPKTGSKPVAKKKPSRPNGRPKNSTDKSPRKQRIAKPKSKPGVAELITWTNKTWDKVSEILTAALLESEKKNNLRQISKAQIRELEHVKIDVLTNLNPLEEFTENDIYEIISAGYIPPFEFRELLENSNVSFESMPMDQFRNAVVSNYIEYLLS